ncbi:MAG: hypothetical protein GX542_02290 [Rhodococcus sp.]|nr:hypothetical protein [Rhodococcus sp. (in: high G+C Gram-positive bacteria)]
MPSWKFTPLELQVAYQHLGADRLPFPLVSTIAGDTQDDVERATREAGRTFVEKFEQDGDDIYVALSLVAGPPVQIVMVGVLTENAQLLRARIGIDHRNVAVLKQEGSIEGQECSDVTLGLVSRAQLGQLIHAILKKLSPGQYQAPSISRRDLDPDSHYDNVFGSSSGQSGYQQAVNFYNRPTSSVGEIIVSSEQVMDPRVVGKGRVLKWFNYTNDGMYLLRDGSDPVVTVPATVDAIGREIMSLVTEAEETLADEY